MDFKFDELDDLLPEGVAPFEIRKVVDGVSNSGKEKVDITFANYNGKTITSSFFLTPAAKWRIKALVNALGLKPDENGAGKLGDNLLGKYVNLDIYTRKYVGSDGVEQSVSDIKKFIKFEEVPF